MESPKYAPNMWEKMQSPTSTAPSKFLPITFVIIIITMNTIGFTIISINMAIIMMTISATSFTLRRMISTRVMKSNCIGLVVPVDKNINVNIMKSIDIDCKHKQQ